MAYKGNPELLRNIYTKKWNINLPHSKYTNLAIFIKIKYYLFWFLIKFGFYIISYKKLEIGHKFTAFIYYYGERKKSILVDKLFKKKLENDVNLIYNIKFSINLFNIVNFLPKKVYALNQKLKTSIKKPKNKKFAWIRDLVYIINICTYSPNTKLLGAFLIKILCSLRKQWAFIKIASNIIKKILPYRSKKINGVKLAIAGKINGRNRKKTVIKSFGRLSTQNLSKNIKYSLSTGYNVYGAFSIKIWIVSLQNKQYNQCAL